MKLGETIKEELGKRSMMPSELARRSGIPHPTISRIIAGEIESPRLEVVQKIAKIFGVSIDYLSTGNKKLENIKNYDKTNIENNFFTCIKIDIDSLKKLVNFTDIKNLMTYQVIDDAMNPTFSIGDWLLIDKGINRIDQDGVYLADYNNKQYIRRFQLSLEDSLKMKADNSNYETEVFNKDMIKKLLVLGKVIYIWNGKRI